MQKCLAFFPGVDRTVAGYEGLIAAQDCLPEQRRRATASPPTSATSARLWEAISPDPVLGAVRDRLPLAHAGLRVGQAVDRHGQAVWHALGPKTIELIHEHVHVDAIRDDLDTLVLDADLLEAVLGTPDPDKKAKEIEIKVSRRLRKHAARPAVQGARRAAGRAEAAPRAGAARQRRVPQGTARARAGRRRSRADDAEPMADDDRGKAALTELFEEVRNEDTPIIVERVVADIDEIVRYVRFDGWQNTHAGEREVKMALRKTLFKYKLHQDQELFDRAYGYIRQYY